MLASRYERRPAMIDRISPALMIKKEDLEHLRAEWLRVPEWIRAHATIVRPAHRYEGFLTLEDHSLVFQGRDVKEKRGFEEVIPLDRITGVSLNLDRHFRGSPDWFFGLLNLKPLIIHYQTDDGRQTAYLFAHFNRQNGRAAGNQEWYETLKGYIGGNGHNEKSQSCR